MKIMMMMVILMVMRTMVIVMSAALVLGSSWYLAMLQSDFWRCIWWHCGGEVDVSSCGCVIQGIDRKRRLTVVVIAKLSWIRCGSVVLRQTS